MTKVRRGFADTSTGQIHYVTAGEGDPVVFLHQTPNSWRYYVDLVPIVTGAGFRFIALDTPGYGDSDRPDPAFQAVEEYAKAIVEFYDAIGLDRPHLVGHLTGSQIAHEVAAAYPDRVGKLVLSEVFNWNSPARQAVHQRLHWANPPRPDGSHLMELWKKTAPKEDTLEALENADHRFHDHFRVNMGKQPEHNGTMGWDGAMPWAMTHHTIWDRTPLITAETLLVNGTNSELKNARTRLSELIKHSTIAEYESTRWNGPQENFPGWTAVVIEFLTKPAR